MLVISNTTPIMSLSSIGRVDLLEKLFNKVIGAQAVYNEIKTIKKYGYAEIESAFFQVMNIKGNSYLGFLLNDLDRGEAETIILAHELSADITIIDERLGCKIARSQNLLVIGTLAVLVMAKAKGLIQTIRPLLDEMIKKGRWYSMQVYADFLKAIGEL